MPETKPTRKTIDVHKDYLMFCLLIDFKRVGHTLLTYVQDTTPYGDEYEAVYKKYESIQKSIDDFEELLQDCVEAKSKAKR